MTAAIKTPPASVQKGRVFHTENTAHKKRPNQIKKPAGEKRQAQ